MKSNELVDVKCLKPGLIHSRPSVSVSDHYFQLSLFPLLEKGIATAPTTRFCEKQNQTK